MRRREPPTCMLLRMSSLGRIRLYAATVVSHAQRRPAQQQHALVALGRRRQVLLHDDVAGAPHRRDDLRQVRALSARHVEDVLPAEAGERLDDRRPVQLAQEGAHALHRTRDQRLRPQLDRKAGQVHLRAGARQAVRVVDHQHAELLEAPPEVERRIERVDLRGARAGIVAQEDHVEVDQARGLARGVRRGQRLRVAGGVAQPARLRAHDLGDDVRPLALRERVDRREGDVVPAPVGRERQVQRGVARALGARVVDHETDAHMDLPGRQRTRRTAVGVLHRISAKIPAWPVRPFAGSGSERGRLARPSQDGRPQDRGRDDDDPHGVHSGPTVVDDAKVAEVLKKLRTLDRPPGPLTGVTEVVRRRRLVRTDPGRLRPGQGRNRRRRQARGGAGTEGRSGAGQPARHHVSAPAAHRDRPQPGHAGRRSSRSPSPRSSPAARCSAAASTCPTSTPPTRRPSSSPPAPFSSSTGRRRRRSRFRSPIGPPSCCRRRWRRPSDFTRPTITDTHTERAAAAVQGFAKVIAADRRRRGRRRGVVRLEEHAREGRRTRSDGGAGGPARCATRRARDRAAAATTRRCGGRGAPAEGPAPTAGARPRRRRRPRPPASGGRRAADPRRPRATPTPAACADAGAHRRRRGRARRRAADARAGTGPAIGVRAPLRPQGRRRHPAAGEQAEPKPPPSGRCPRIRTPLCRRRCSSAPRRNRRYAVISRRWCGTPNRECR